MDIKWLELRWMTIGATVALSATVAHSAEIVQPYVVGGLTFSDNINQSQQAQSAFVLDVGAGFDFDYQTAKNSLTGKYEIRQFIYSDDSDKNSAYQDMDLNWLYATKLEGVGLYANAQIDNVARFNDQNAITDIFAGNTVQESQLEAGATYSNPIQGTAYVDSRAYYRINDNSDNLGNNSGYGVTLFSTDGYDADVLFWQSDWSYDVRTGRESGLDSEYVVLRQSLGIQTPWDVAPLVRVNYENITGESGENVESLYYGAGLRYSYNRLNYLELSYNIADDPENEDYWGGVINIQSTSNTRFAASYDRRFFGDAYDVELSHRSRKVTNTLSYNENPTNYDRDSFVSGGGADGEIFLSREARWNVEVNAGRTLWNFYVSYKDTEDIEAVLLELDESDLSLGYGGKVTHQLSRRTSSALSIDFDDYDFFQTQTENNAQDDFYQRYKATLDHQLSRSISSDFELSYLRRDSSVGSFNYDEIRASANIRLDF
ncbi:outer membrane beta-barrel protein [Vibrio ulleungensis]|uniref:Outer membrane beta-barrel protein n=1 Tax=Vibrio ulleungensis TaxID=2807619 RepID=A0ABS2HLK5_9VIBR|nr:outer membrane beta-barrel protein [Vibrio ulleungensis]MBM7037007.1 outer membrane beta-barrel protein [Vibrio ulleungensis]